MALATRCPHCQTIFRVAVDQLKLRGGIVRCGHCQEVFDGNACIVDLSKVDVEAELAAHEAPAVSASTDDEVPVYEVDLGHALDPNGILPQTETEAPPPASEPEIVLDLSSETTAAPQPEPRRATFADLLQRQIRERVPADEKAEQGQNAEFSLDLDVEEEPAATEAPTPAPTPAPLPEPEPEPDIDLQATIDEVPARPSFSAWKPGVDLLHPTPSPLTQDEAHTHIDVEHGPVRAHADTEGRIEPRLDSPATGSRLDLIVDDKEDDAPGFVKQGRAEEKHGRLRRILYVLGAVGLVLLLAVQGIYQFRNPLALQFPALKPSLVQACGLLGCRVDLPTQIDQLSIETGELQVVSGGIHSYTSLLRNQAPITQAWPAIELRLRDDKRQVLLRRVLLPKDYLPANVDAAKGFGPRSEQAINLHFDLGTIAASGYDVGIFYP